jgi:hypothetical protein
MRAEEDAMPSDLERLAFLGVDPASLDPAPSQRVRADWLARIDSHSPDRRRCCSCRALAVATRVVDLAELGQRWHDQCRDCMIAGIRLNWAAGRPMEGRYRVTLWTGDRPILEGWWEDLATAEDKNHEVDRHLREPGRSPRHPGRRSGGHPVDELVRRAVAL